MAIAVGTPRSPVADTQWPAVTTHVGATRLPLQLPAPEIDDGRDVGVLALVGGAAAHDRLGRRGRREAGQDGEGERAAHREVVPRAPKP